MVIRRSTRWVWAGRIAFGLIVAGLVAYLVVVGLDKADKVSSSISVVLALTALAAPYLLPRPQEEHMVHDHTQMGEIVVADSGPAKATGGGEANTGAETTERDTRAVRVTRSGTAVADGPGSVANTGVRRIPPS